MTLRDTALVVLMVGWILAFSRAEHARTEAHEILEQAEERLVEARQLREEAVNISGECGDALLETRMLLAACAADTERSHVQLCSECEYANGDGGVGLWLGKVTP